MKAPACIWYELNPFCHNRFHGKTQIYINLHDITFTIISFHSHSLPIGLFLAGVTNVCFIFWKCRPEDLAYGKVWMVG